MMTMRLKPGFAMAAAGLAVAASTQAAAQAFNGSQVIQAVGIADLQQFVQQRGDTVVDTGKNGVVSVLAKTKGGLNYSLIGGGCNQRGVVGCQGIFMQVKYTSTADVTDATLSQANTRFAALKIWKDQAGKMVGVSRYIVTRDGVTRQNVLDNVDVLLGLAPAAAQIAFGKAPQAVKAP